MALQAGRNDDIFGRFKTVPRIRERAPRCAALWLSALYPQLVYSLLNPRSVFDISITSKLNIHKLVKYYQRFTQAPLSAFAFR